ncbi:hypothetical protein BW36_01361 [Micrococcus luteus]|nr:hypothetical protein BW36_01361 [Micrococcus luteus]
MVLEQLALGVGAADRAQRRGGREEGAHAVVLDEPPERAGVGGAHGLALVHDRGGPGQERAVDDVGVPHDPAHVRGRAHRLSRADVVDVLHGPAQGDGVAPVVPDDALRLARGARGVQHVQRVGGLHRDAVGRLGGRDGLAPVLPARAPAPVGVRERGLEALAVVDQHRAHGVRGGLERLGHGGQVLDPALGLDAAGAGEHDVGGGVVDAGGELARGEAAEDHGVHRAEPRARQHRDVGLRDHRQIHEDAVSLADAARGQGAGQTGHRVRELGVRVAGDLAGHRGVVDQRDGVPAARLDVPVQAVVGGVQLAVREPAVQGRGGVVEGARGRDGPVDGARRVEPEPLGVAEGAGVGVGVRAGGAVFGGGIVGRHGPRVVLWITPGKRSVYISCPVREAWWHTGVPRRGRTTQPPHAGRHSP